MKKITILQLLLLFSIGVFAKDIKVPGDYKKIQDAINASSEGDRIMIASGNYSEYLNIKKSLKLIGTAPCTITAGGSPVSGCRNKYAHVNVSDSEVSIHNIDFISTTSKGSYCRVGIDSKDALLDLKGCAINGNTESYFLVDGGTIDVVETNLGTIKIHAAPPIAFVVDDVGGVIIKGVNSENSGVKNFMVINETYPGTRESLILISETNIGTTTLERGRKGSYTMYATVNEAPKLSEAEGNEIITISDPKLKAYLVGETRINKNGDNEIQVSEALVADHIDVRGLGITDLSVLDKFPNLVNLFCNANELTKLDVSNNKLLQILICNSNDLKTLDVSNNTKLIELICSDSKLTKLDLTKNIELQMLICSENDLGSMDFSKNVNLKELYCDETGLSKLDISKNLKLTNLNYSKNNVSNLNLTKHVALKSINCSENNLNSLNLSKNTSLKSISCTGNNFVSLDFSANEKLKEIYCSNNQLTSLKCGSEVLKSINISSNAFETFDFSSYPKLTKVDCYKNNLKELDFSNNPKLSGLDARYNVISSIDLSKNNSIYNVDLSYNKLETIDIRNSKPSRFYFSHNDNLKCVAVDDPAAMKKKWARSLGESVNVTTSCTNVASQINSRTNKSVTSKSSSQPSVSNGLIVNYPFNGNVNDIAGKGNSTKLKGSPTYISDHNGQAKKAIQFIGKSDQFSGLYSSNPANFSDKEVTISCWYKGVVTTDQIASGSIIKTYDKNMNFVYDLNQFYDTHGAKIGAKDGYIRLKFDVRGENQNPRYVSTSVDEKWHHITVSVKAAGEIKMYLDGVLVDSKKFLSKSLLAVPEMFKICSDDKGAGYNITYKPRLGGISDLRIFNRELSVEEVKLLLKANNNQEEVEWGADEEVQEQFEGAGQLAPPPPARNIGSTEEENFEETGMLAPPPPSRNVKPTIREKGIQFDADKMLFTKYTGNDKFEYAIPNKLQYQNHFSTNNNLLISYNSIGVGDNYLGIWDEKLAYVSEYKFGKMKVNDMKIEEETTNKTKIVAVYFDDVEHNTKFVAFFNQQMKYLGQFEVTGTTNVQFHFKDAKPILNYTFKGDDYMVLFDRAGNEIKSTKL